MAQTRAESLWKRKCHFSLCISKTEVQIPPLLFVNEMWLNIPESSHLIWVLSQIYYIYLAELIVLAFIKIIPLVSEIFKWYNTNVKHPRKKKIEPAFIYIYIYIYICLCAYVWVHEYVCASMNTCLHNLNEDPAFCWNCTQTVRDDIDFTARKLLFHHFLIFCIYFCMHLYIYIYACLYVIVYE